MIDIVEKFLNKYKLTDSVNTLLVGFSGGYDSVSLLHILSQLSNKNGFRLVALHLNHNWRGQDSLSDELKCRRFCEKNRIEFISETLSETAPKTETFARQARYDFFLKCAEKYPNSSILTAHNLSDNVETVLYRIVKGTGIKGLQGIPEARSFDGVFIYRPLLSVSRNQIEDYCRSEELDVCIDNSNFDLTYQRNFIRHKVFPQLKKINPFFEKSVISLTKLALSESNIVEEYLNLIKKDLYSEDKISTNKFLGLSDDVKMKIIYDFCLEQKLDYDFKMVSDILEFINKNSLSKSGSRCSITNNLWLFVSKDYIYPIDRVQNQKKLKEFIIKDEGEYFIPEFNSVFSIEKFPDGTELNFPLATDFFAYVDLSKMFLSGNNLVLRTRRDGDFITPFGMKGKMKLKKYLTSKAVPMHEKDKLLMLCLGSEVLWVIGLGLSENIKVVKSPTHVLKLESRFKELEN